MVDLKPLKRVKPSKPFGVSDIEASRWVEFLCEGFYTKIYNQNTGEMDGFYKYFLNHNDYFDFIFSRHNPVDVIYAHYGGGYDFMFWLQHSLDSENYMVHDMIGRGSKLLCISISKIEYCDLNKLPKGVQKKDVISFGKKPIGYVLKKTGRIVWEKDFGKFPAPSKREKIIFSKKSLYGYKSRTIQFRDSTAFLPFKLEDLCKSFDVKHKKLKIDYDTMDKVTPELLEYMEYDHKGLYEVIEKYQDWDLVKKSGTSFTMAGQAMRVFRTFIKEPIPALNKNVDEFVRAGYYGGRTEIFKPLYYPRKQHKFLKCADVNSLYPTVMRANDFPTRPLKIVRDYQHGEMGFYKATVYVPENMYIPPLGTIAEVNKSKKLIFPVGVFSGTWSSIELDYAMSLGCEILEIEKGYVFENGGPIFSEYINTLYQMRMEGRANGDGVTDMLCKLLMNSLYGRFGLSLKKEHIEFDDFLGGGGDVLSEIATKKGLVRLIKNEKYLDKSFSNVSIANWVTSLSRVHMHKLYMKDQKSLFYTDTDSLFTLSSFNWGNDLGELKLEYECDAACFLLPKTYAISSPVENFKMTDKKGKIMLTDRKIVAKGFSKYSVANWNLEDYVGALEGSMRMGAKKDGYYLSAKQDRKFATFKAAIQKGKLLTMLDESTKGIKSVYDKRTIIKNEKGEYDTKPLVMMNNELVN